MGAAEEVEIVKVVVAVPFTAGVNEEAVRLQVTVGVTGEIAQLNPTAELNPFREVTVTVEVVEFPADVVAEEGDTAKLKAFNVSE